MFRILNTKIYFEYSFKTTDNKVITDTMTFIVDEDLDKKDAVEYCKKYMTSYVKQNLITLQVRCTYRGYNTY